MSKPFLLYRLTRRDCQQAVTVGFDSLPCLPYIIGVSDPTDGVKHQSSPDRGKGIADGITRLSSGKGMLSIGQYKTFPTRSKLLNWGTMVRGRSRKLRPVQCPTLSRSLLFIGKKSTRVCFLDEHASQHVSM